MYGNELERSRNKSRETNEEEEESKSRGTGEKWKDMRHILEVKRTNSADRLKLGFGGEESKG